MTVRDCGCENLELILGDGPYTRPDVDPTPPPWVDSAEPDSYDFGGFLITRIDGLHAAPVDRPVTARIGDGAVIGRRRLGARVVTVTGILIGSTCCGIDYGLRWLSSVLAGAQDCGTSCGGCEFTYLTCCPEICEDADGFTSYAECGEPYFRTLKDVALTQEVQVISEVGGDCGGCCKSCPALEVQFQLTAGRPHAYREPVNVCCTGWPDPGPDDECIEWSTDPDCMTDEQVCAAQVATPCPLDPACPVVEVPDLPLPMNNCQCEPLAGYRRVCCTIPATASPVWAEAVPVITLTAGTMPLRSVRIRFYENPLGLGIDELDPCSFCTELNVSFLPVGATLVLDGTMQRGTVNCPGRATTSASSILAGAQGAPLVWPVISCGVPYLVCVEADSASITDDSVICLDIVVREV